MRRIMETNHPVWRPLAFHLNHKATNAPVQGEDTNPKVSEEPSFQGEDFTRPINHESPIQGKHPILNDDQPPSFMGQNENDKNDSDAQSEFENVKPKVVSILWSKLSSSDQMDQGSS